MSAIAAEQILGGKKMHHLSIWVILKSQRKMSFEHLQIVQKTTQIILQLLELHVCDRRNISFQKER